MDVASGGLWVPLALANYLADVRPGIGRKKVGKIRIAVDNPENTDGWTLSHRRRKGKDKKGKRRMKRNP